MFYQETEHSQKLAVKSRREIFRLTSLVPLLFLTSVPMPFGRLAKYSEAQAVDPMTAIAVAQLGLKIIDGFTAKSDGGLSATLAAHSQMLQLISEQLDFVTATLGQIQASIILLPEEMRKQNEADRLIGYYDQIRAGANAFREKFVSEQSAERRQLAGLRKDYKVIADRMQIERGTISNYYSLVPAMAAPLALAIEIAARRKSGAYNELLPALAGYEAWVSGMLNETINGSVRYTLASFLTQHDRLISELKNFSLGLPDDWDEREVTSVELGQCLRPKVWPRDINLEMGGDHIGATPINVRITGTAILKVRVDDSGLYRMVGIEKQPVSFSAAAASDCADITTNVNVNASRIWGKDSLDPGRGLNPSDGLISDIEQDPVTVNNLRGFSNNFDQLSARIDQINALRINISIYAKTCEICRNTINRINEHRALI